MLIRFSIQDHIVPLKYADFNPGPRLYFEYVSGGSLESYSSTTVFQTRQVTIQLLGAFAYLHGKQPPIAHRDIKPENVLVKHWSKDNVHVKLADFGLSKRSNDLRTFCGTLLYAAPEIYCAGLVGKRHWKKYEPLVDNWSLSVLLVNLECHQLPEYSRYYSRSETAWAKELVKFVSEKLEHDETNRLLSFLLEDILVVDLKGRKPTEECYQEALRLFGGKIQTPAPNDVEDSREVTDVATPTTWQADPIDSEPHQATNPQAIDGDEAPEIITRAPSSRRKRRRSSEDQS